MTTAPPKPAPTDWGAIAAFCLVGALVLIGVGFYTMYHYDTGYESSTKIVEGDAYNYVILAARGVGWMLAGLGAALCGVGCLLARARA